MQWENDQGVFLHTVIQMAIFEGMYCCGKFNVNCDIVDSPNIRNPVTATPAYTIVTTVKLKQWRIV